jgi:hypothetical protein
MSLPSRKSWTRPARIGKSPGPMLHDYAARVSEGAVWVLEEEVEIAAIIVLLPFAQIICSSTPQRAHA